VGAVSQNSDNSIHANESDLHHLRVNRTWFIVRQCFPGKDVKVEEVVEVVKERLQWNKIDPAPLRYEKRTREVYTVWERLALHITHYGTQRFFFFDQLWSYQVNEMNIRERLSN
jgi:hypothetical protein